MSSVLQIPQVRVEIFRQPAFWDDNFVVGWDSVNSAVVETDGDVITVEIASGKTYGAMEKVVTFYATPYRYIIVRCTALTGLPWKVYVRRASDLSWLLAASYGDTGIKTVDLDSVTKDKCDMVRIRVDGGAGNYVKLDYIGICKKTMLIPSDTWDLLTELQITLPLLSSGIAGVNPLKFPNFNAEYTGKISPFDVILIYLWRKGDTMKKIFGGRIVQPGTAGSGGSQEYYVKCEAVDHGQALQAPESLLQKRYSKVNGRTIIKEALACCVVTDKFVDVDEEIESTHDFEFDDISAFDVINEVCRLARTLGAVVGFDSYIDPAGNCHVFKRGKYVSEVSLSERQIDSYKKSLDVHWIRNKIKVYGAKEKNYPQNKDKLTEQDADEPPSSKGWSGGTLSWNDVDPQVGDKSLQTVKTATKDLDLYNNFPDVPSLDCRAWKRGSYSSLNFLINIVSAPNPDGETFVYIQLYAPNLANRFQYILTCPAFPRISKEDEWFKFNIPLGLEADGWCSLTGSPDWSNIQQIRFYIAGINEGNFTVRVDGFYFGKAMFSGSAENKISQAKYGVRCREPEVDDTLMSDAECEARARSLCDFLSEPITKFTMTVEGDNRYRPGDKLRVQLTNDNIDDWFHIIKVRHVIRGVQWDTELTLSNEPEYIDWVFAMVGPPRKKGATVVVSASETADFTDWQQAIDVVKS